MATSEVPFSYDRVLETILRPLTTGKVGKTIVVTGINISNTLEEAYNIEFYLITPTHHTQGPLYRIQLSEGDFVLDDTIYRLAPNASIWARSNKTTVHITVDGYEETVIA